MFSKITSESLKILNLSGDQAKTLQIEHTIKILDECIWKVETAFLLQTILVSLERQIMLSAGHWGGLMRVLREHQLLEESFTIQEQKWLEVEREEWKNHLAGREQPLCGSFRNVLRYLQAHPSVLEGLSRGATDRVSQKLVEGLMGLQGLLRERQLVNPAEEQGERDRSRYIQELSLRHCSNMEVVSTLEEDVAATTKDKNAEILKRSKVIHKLKSAMLQREKISEDFVIRLLQDLENQNLSYRKTSEGRRANMQQDINQLWTQLNNLITENREVEMALRRRRNKVESEIENWIQKYDTDMSEKQVELEEVSGYYAKESEELQELEEHYNVLELEYSQIMEDRRLAQEQKEEEERERVIKEQNAVVIQAHWRGFQVRKAMKGKKTGKKGKKGKGRKVK